jgi:hypothetical protein
MNALGRYNEAKKRQLQLAEDRFKAFAIQLGNAIIKGTPVDTGRASGNWYADVNSASSEKSDAATQSGALTRVLLKGAQVTLNDTFTITNNLEYINALEYGHSKQAPQGMVRINLRKLSAEYQRKWGF